MTRIADGLWRWTTAHPDWKPSDDWDEEVGCVYCETDEAVVLVDPLVPGELAERTRFLEALDRDVVRLDRPVVCLLTCTWHARSSEELASRYDGRVVTRAAGEEPPTGVRVLDIPSEGEWVVWLEQRGALVPGDVVLGTDDGLVLCPESWLESRSRARLAQDLLPLLDLPVERVLTSHGPPVLERCDEALALLLEPYAPA